MAKTLPMSQELQTTLALYQAQMHRTQEAHIAFTTAERAYGLEMRLYILECTGVDVVKEHRTYKLQQGAIILDDGQPAPAQEEAPPKEP